MVLNELAVIVHGTVGTAWGQDSLVFGVLPRLPVGRTDVPLSLHQPQSEWRHFLSYDELGRFMHVPYVATDSPIRRQISISVHLAV
jgi:hypothetical protein